MDSSIECYPMIGGDDPYSYAQNSITQKMIINSAKELIYKSIRDNLDIKNLSLGASNSFKIVDLGCSTGPNTFTAVKNIIEAIHLKLEAESQPLASLEFQVFFNDHVGNDFNLLFRSLPTSRPYFTAGVPGSFHGRLFPKASLHFVHSSNAINWLSRVPKETLDIGSDTWYRAYSAQYKSDLNSFFTARAEEVVSGGLMAILIGVLGDGVSMSESMSETFSYVVYNNLKSSLMDMAELGLVSEEKVNSFNLPFYYASIKEVEHLVIENGSFSIKNMLLLDDVLMPIVEQTIAMSRSFMECFVQKHFGNEILDELFERYAKKFFKKKNNFVGPRALKVRTLFLMLKRNLY